MIKTKYELKMKALFERFNTAVFTGSKLALGIDLGTYFPLC